MKTIFGVFLLFIAQSSLGQSGFFAGNTGDGILINEQMYLLDLVENQTHLNPYVGEKILPRIQDLEWMTARVTPLGVDKDLLLRKISDAEDLKLGLGVFILHTINNYSWSFSPNLPPKIEDTPVIDFKKRHPLARRVLNTIRIDKNNFAQLSDIQRVALILHEAIYALVKVQCENGICTQSGYSARALNAHLFDATSFSCVNRIGNCLGAAFESQLGIDPNAKSFRPGEIRLSTQNNTDNPLLKKITLKSSDIESLLQISFPMAQSACRNIFTESYDGAPRSVILTLMRSSFVFAATTYKIKVPAGIAPYQSAAEIKYREPVCIFVGDFSDAVSCELAIYKAINQWYDKTNLSSSPLCPVH